MMGVVRAFFGIASWSVGNDFGHFVVRGSLVE